MPDPKPEPKPIDNLENLDLLKTDLIAFIIAEVGLDMFQRGSKEVPAFTALDIEQDPMACMAQSFSKTLSTNILDGGGTGTYPAVVLLPFKDGPNGRQACKAIVPQVHPCADNPFNAPNDYVRAEMISHFPIFTFNDGPTENSSPLVPGSIILVSFDNPDNYWTSGAIEKVIKGRPDALPEWAVAIEGIKEMFDNAAAWANEGLSILGDLLGFERDPATENSSHHTPEEIEAQVSEAKHNTVLLQAVGTPYNWGAGNTTVKGTWPQGTWSTYYKSTAGKAKGAPPPDRQARSGYDCSGFAQAALVMLGHIPDSYNYPDAGHDIGANYALEAARKGTSSVFTEITDLTTLQTGDWVISRGHVEVVNGLNADGTIELIGASGRGSGPSCYGQKKAAYVKLKKDIPAVSAGQSMKTGVKVLGYVRIRS